jgi:transglutaminase-like putative cysteine protease
MPIRVALAHRTTYGFARPVVLGPHLLRLRPAPHARTPIESYALTVVPAEHRIEWYDDLLGNRVARLQVPGRTRRLELAVELVAVLGSVEPAVLVGEAGRLATELTTGVHHRVAYRARPEPGVQTPEETLRLGAGSCRDSAWLLVRLLRERGLTARYVSGYLIRLGPAGDSAELHAWCEVLLPDLGWVGLDPTSGGVAGEGHIPLAATSDPAEAAPVSGVTEQVEVTLAFASDVRRLDPAHDTPASASSR